MSFRLKPRKTPVAYVPPRRTHAEAVDRKVAAAIPDQGTLELLLSRIGQGKPEHVRAQLRSEMLERVRPHLKFQVTVSADSPCVPSPAAVP